MEKNARIYVAGGAHGLVGSAIVRRLKAAGYSNIFFQSSNRLDVTNQAATFHYLKNASKAFQNIFLKMRANYIQMQHHLTHLYL